MLSLAPWPVLCFYGMELIKDSTLWWVPRIQLGQWEYTYLTFFLSRLIKHLGKETTLFSFFQKALKLDPPVIYDRIRKSNNNQSLCDEKKLLKLILIFFIYFVEYIFFQQFKILQPRSIKRLYESNLGYIFWFTKITKKVFIIG